MQMSPDKDVLLRRKHPLVFQTALLNDEHIRCGDGWFDLLDQLCTKLEKLILQQPKEERPRYAAVQIKEKYGLLRFYTNEPPTPRMAEHIRQAEHESEATCDVCGAPGDLRSNKEDGSPDYWVRTRCKEHEHWKAWKDA